MKKVIRYIMIYLPFMVGIVLFCFNIVNLFSSFCLCIGGYIAIKNSFDYRLIKKNRNDIGEKRVTNKKENVVVRGIKIRKRERVRVRKK